MAKGIIYKAMSGFYYVKSTHEVAECRARGRFRLCKSSPLVGDIVNYTLTEQGKGIISEILPRKNVLVRPPIANIDKLVMIVSAAIPVTDKFLIDRMVAISTTNGCEPVICINKIDLDPADELFDIYTGSGFDVVRTCATCGEGITELTELIKGAICAFTGNSGVGKSSILNAIDPNFKITIGDISKKLGRGRHTTRHVELYELSCGALIADTPGFSAFDTGHIADKDELHFLFREFEPHIGECKFLDCAHMDEPDCAILKAIDERKIHKSRYESYRRLYKQALEYKEWEHK
ncbi:MAG: ribosome small subunit-dependent GTPase A [Oscillospiraceae bacterium]|nr:ribosome small subunit-dependent GTPase A [Oscillospiraceae bacterium]MCL2278316.1 ribosome small subunit-dependent GTPase A [Oscillospiraceae bacterium]